MSDTKRTIEEVAGIIRVMPYQFKLTETVKFTSLLNERLDEILEIHKKESKACEITRAIANGTPLTPDILADLLMEERIRGELDSDTTFEKDIIRDVKCRLTVDIIDHRPCYCGSELREVWRESEINNGE